MGRLKSSLGKIIAIFLVVYLVFTNPVFAQIEEQKIERHKSVDTTEVPSTESSGSQTTTDQSSTANNQNTGADSTNNATNNSLNTTTSSSSNTALSSSNVSTTTSTGSNQANYNTGNGTVQSGSANSNTTVVDTLNSGATDAKSCVKCDLPGMTNEASNSATGAGSINNASNSSTDSATFSNSNDLKIRRHVSSEITSGNNQANYNTGSGSVIAGNATGSINLIAIGNSNIMGGNQIPIVVFDVNSNQGGNIDFRQLTDPNLICSFCSISSNGVSLNSSTGANSVNNASNSQNTFYTVNNNNTGTIDNNISLNASSGGNSASYNTGNGNITTGNVETSVNVVNFLNSNLYASNALIGIVNIYGDFNGNIILPDGASGGEGRPVAFNSSASNLNTGVSSVNNASNNSSSTTDVNNKNTAVVDSSIKVDVQTGNNTSSYNTGGGSVTSGDSTVGVQNSTIANTNSNGDVWWLVLVNKLGQWVGYIVGQHPGTTSASSDGIVATDSSSSPNYQATNSSTGSGSSNNASNDSSSTTAFNNTNSSTVSNQVDVTATTGNNSSSYNTGGGDVKSGDVLIGANLVNFLNTDFLSGKWLVAIVNVFGSWFGNIGTVDQLVKVGGSGNTGGSDTNTDSSKSSSNNSSASNQNQNSSNSGGGSSGSSAGGEGRVQTTSSQNSTDKFSFKQSVLGITTGGSGGDNTGSSGQNTEVRKENVFTANYSGVSTQSLQDKGWFVKSWMILLSAGTLMVVLGLGVLYIRKYRMPMDLRKVRV